VTLLQVKSVMPSRRHLVEMSAQREKIGGVFQGPPAAQSVLRNAPLANASGQVRQVGTVDRHAIRTMSYSLLNLQPNSIHDVCVSHVESSDGSFVVQLMANAKNLDDLLFNLTALNGLEQFGIHDVVDETSPCLVRSRTDNVLYRGLLFSRSPRQAQLLTHMNLYLIYYKTF